MYSVKDMMNITFDYLKNSFAPYSKFSVAATVFTENNYYSGVNVENCSYGLTICAERNAMFHAYSEGVRKNDIKAMMVVTDTNDITFPCGACRQVMQELISDDIPVYLSNGKTIIKTSVKQLLPDSFKKEDIL